MRMTFPGISKLAAISAVQLICLASASAQTRVNPQAGEMAAFSKRIAAYLSLQKKVESKLSPQKETKDPEQIKSHVAALAQGIRAARVAAKPGELFDGASELFRRSIQEDVKNRSVRDVLATMQEVPKSTPPKVNADYPETAPLATVPPLILTRLPRLPDGLEYRFMGRDLILYDAKANLIVDVLRDAAPAAAKAAVSK